MGALPARAALPAVVVNARQCPSDFAKGTGQLAKPDAIDAAILALFGVVVQTTVRPLESMDILEFREIYDRCGQLVRMLAVEKTIAMPLRVAPPRVLRNIERHIGYLQARIAELEDRMDGIVQHRLPSVPKTTFCNPSSASDRRSRGPCWPTCPNWARKPAKASRLWSAWLPTPTTAAQKRPAPIFVAAEAKVRMGLYQAAVAAIRHCPHMKAFYASLKARGKASKLALIAVARKILVLANALIRTMTPYQAHKLRLLKSYDTQYGHLRVRLTWYDRRVGLFHDTIAREGVKAFAPRWREQPRTPGNGFPGTHVRGMSAWGQRQPGLYYKPSAITTCSKKLPRVAWAPFTRRAIASAAPSWP